jgi:hypothetical protein
MCDYMRRIKLLAEISTVLPDAEQLFLTEGHTPEEEAVTMRLRQDKCRSLSWVCLLQTHDTPINDLAIEVGISKNTIDISFWFLDMKLFLLHFSDPILY